MAVVAGVAIYELMASGRPYGMIVVRGEVVRESARRSEGCFKSEFGRKHLDRHLGKLAACPEPGRIVVQLVSRARSSMVRAGDS